MFVIDFIRGSERLLVALLSPFGVHFLSVNACRVVNSGYLFISIRPLIITGERVVLTAGCGLNEQGLPDQKPSSSEDMSWLFISFSLKKHYASSEFATFKLRHGISLTDHRLIT